MVDTAARFARFYQAHDPSLAALRRAGRAAIVMPSMFALGIEVIGNPLIATFAAFGSFGMLLLVDFGGPMGDRLRAQAALAATGAVLVCIGTLASRAWWLAAAVTAVVGFCILFAGVVSSVLAGATVSLLLAFVLPVTLAGPASSIPDRLEGWGMASAAAFAAVALLWPLPARDPLRGAVVAACRALAGRLRADVALVRNGESAKAEREQAVERSDAALAALEKRFFATPYRPTGLTTTARAVVRLVDELAWLNAVIVLSHPEGALVEREVCAVKTSAAAVLDACASLLEKPMHAPGELRSALVELRAALEQLEAGAASRLPERWEAANGGASLVSSLDPGFRAEQIGFAVSEIAGNVELAASAEMRGWMDRLVGRQPKGLSGTFSAAQERAFAHAAWHSVWLHNSLRGAVGLTLAVAIADLSGVQHSFWIVLGTLSVLRSNALATGENVVRGLLGTAFGVVAGGALVLAIGTNTTVLWFLLPLAILLAGVAPAAVSFAAGQAGFTITLVILFNIVAPSGWHVGLVRIEDVAIGFAVSVAVGLLFWPRGAAAALDRALGQAYTESARYLAAAVGFALGCCDVGMPTSPPPRNEASRAAAAARRLDDAFRSYLAERGAKPTPLASVSGLVSGVVALRLLADSVLDLWDGEDGAARAERDGARRELLETTADVEEWYERLAAGLGDGGSVPDAPSLDEEAQARLVQSLRGDLSAADGRAADVAVRLVWTGDHLDAARRLQRRLVEPARTLRRPGEGFLRDLLPAARG